MSRLMILSVAGLVLFAGAIGVITGLRYAPVSETDIILRAAEAYHAETGGDHSHCYARPSPLEAVRLVVICAAELGEDGAWARAYDRWGRDVTDGLAGLDLGLQI